MLVKNVRFNIFSVFLCKLHYFWQILDLKYVEQNWVLGLLYLNNCMYHKLIGWVYLDWLVEPVQTWWSVLSLFQLGGLFTIKAKCDGQIKLVINSFVTLLKLFTCKYMNIYDVMKFSLCVVAQAMQLWPFCNCFISIPAGTIYVINPNSFYLYLSI